MKKIISKGVVLCLIVSGSIVSYAGAEDQMKSSIDSVEKYRVMDFKDADLEAGYYAGAEDQMKSSIDSVEKYRVMDFKDADLEAGYYAGAEDQMKSSIDSVEKYRAMDFKDVDLEAWYYDDVKLAYESELINGMSSDCFSPDENLTYAQAVKLAACLNQKYTEGSITLKAGVPWYETYVDYCKSHGIISDNYEWDENITRAGYMEIFANALPEEALISINNVSDGSIPDVSSDYPVASSIYKLYRAGIVNGIDEAHCCSPESYIRRCEVAAVLTRLMIQDKRISFTMNTNSKIVLPVKDSAQVDESALSCTMKGYQSIKALYDDSYDVIEADVYEVDQNNYTSGSVNIALSKVRVLQSYKGNVENGQVISIAETGERRQEGDLSVDAVPLLNNNMRVFLFLTKPDKFFLNNEDCYGIIGVYQGKFFVDGNDCVYASSDFSSRVASLLGIDNKMCVKDFKSMILNCK